MKNKNYWLQKIKNAYLKITAKRYSTFAGTLVFFLLLSIIPFVFILILLFNAFNVDFQWFFELEIFSDYKKIIGILLDSAEGATQGTSIFFIITAIYSSTNFFYQMRRSGELIYNCNRKKAGLILRFSAAIFVIILMFIGVIFGAIFFSFQNIFGELLPSVFIRILIYCGVGLVIFFVLILLNLYICPYKNTINNTLKGSLFTLIFWSASSVVFSLYTNYLSNFERLYGAFAFFMVFILWLYLIMQGLIIGVILNMKDTILKKEKSY
jgi:YihY family inner membrane protein